MRLIPQDLDSEKKQSPTDFTRKSKLTFPRLITFILSLSCSGKNDGVDIKAGEFFKTAKRSRIWLNVEAIHRSTLTKARKKVSWEIFQDLFHEVVKLGYDFFPDDPKFQWKGKSVFGVDGSKFNLPATAKIRKTLDPKSGLKRRAKGHYPQCLVSTVYDVFRRLPVTRTVVNNDGSEREEVKAMLPQIPSNGILMFDRGYPSWELFDHLSKNYDGFYLFRCKGKATLRKVENFLSSGSKEETIMLEPTGRFARSLGKKELDKIKPLKLRLIRLESPGGPISVLITNLLNRKTYPKDEIIDLYYKRWEIESFYRDEKVTLEVERFHAKTCNGIKQELYATLIMSVIARLLMVLQSVKMKNSELQFKNTIRSLAHDAAILAPDALDESLRIFKELLKQIIKVKYYRPKVPRPSQPRVTKRAVKKWSVLKAQKLAKA